MKLDPKTKGMMIEHIKAHNNYPTTRDDIIAACENMSEFTREQKDWFASALPAGTFRNADEVIRAVKW